MLVTTQNRMTGESYLESLKCLVENRQADLQWLVVAHNDPVMLRRLSKVVSEHAAAILQIPQRDWDFGGDAFNELVTWSISTAGVQHLLMVGHSQSGPPPEAASRVGDDLDAIDPTNSSQTSYQRLLNGAKRVQDEFQRSKDHFVERIESLGEIETLQEALSSRRLRLHTLFYVEESGIFLVYDIVTQKLRTIGE